MASSEYLHAVVFTPEVFDVSNGDISDSVKAINSTRSQVSKMALLMTNGVKLDERLATPDVIHRFDTVLRQESPQQPLMLLYGGLLKTLRVRSANTALVTSNVALMKEAKTLSSPVLAMGDEGVLEEAKRLRVTSRASIGQWGELDYFLSQHTRAADR